MALKMTFELRLKSDYHIGAGHGLGSVVDSALHRDVDGMPVLRGTTVSGLLRNALYELLQLEPLHTPENIRCQASGKEDPRARFCGQWNPDETEFCPVCRIFGSPGVPKRWRISSARPVGAPDPAQSGWEEGETGARIAPHVRVNPRTRRAEAGKLFFREEGDGRLSFQFTTTCDARDPETLGEAAWLLAAARNVRYLGSARRRGRGECELHLIAVEGAELWEIQPEENQTWESWLLDKFEQVHLEKQPLRATLPSLSFTPSASADHTPVRILLIARLDEPLILSQKSEAGNEFETVEYIPGAALRGAIANLVAERYDFSQTNSMVYQAFVELFFHDRVRYSTLYPGYRPGSRSERLYPAVPVPGGLMSCEIHPGYADGNASLPHGVMDFTHRTALDDYEPKCSQCNGHSDLKPLSGFVSLQTTPHTVKVTHIQEMHVRLANETRRAAKGQLYSFDALAPGQYFVGELWCADAAAWDDLRALGGLPEKGTITLRLGKANRRGYGKVTLWTEPHTGAHPWYQLPQTRQINLDGELTLSLLTDTITVDAWGRYRAGFDAAWLENLLGVKVELRRSFCSTRPVDAFNNQTGLPRWRDVALCAGSAVGFVIAEPLTSEQRQAVQEKIDDLEQNGLGLRCNEGFGRVVFNHPLYRQWANLDNRASGLNLRTRGLLPGKMAPTFDTTGEIAVEAEFRRQWEHCLQQDRQQYAGKRDPFADEKYAPLARLLRVQPPDSKDAVDNFIAQLGHFETLIPPAQQAELKVRDSGRASTEFFRAKASVGLNVFKELCAELQDKIIEQTDDLQGDERARLEKRCWRMGMEMLAERIAEMAQKTKEEGKEGQ